MFTCPDWCTEKPGHVDSIDGDGLLRRTHAREMTAVSIDCSLGDGP